MFSPQALKEANDIEGGIEYLMEFYEGKFESKEGSLEASDSKKLKTLIMRGFTCCK